MDIQALELRIILNGLRKIMFPSLLNDNVVSLNKIGLIDCYQLSFR